MINKQLVAPEIIGSFKILVSLIAFVVDIIDL
jgi:hypothetical protein